MATIQLYAGKVNQMSDLIGDVKKSVSEYQSELFSLQTKTLQINSSVCNVDDVVRSIQASTQTQDLKMDTLDTLQKDTEQFITDVVKIDNEVADLINHRKDEFYQEYTHLKPDSEKTVWDKAKDMLKTAAEMCKEVWNTYGKMIVAALFIAALAALTGGASLLAILKGALLGALKGILLGLKKGALIGGFMGLINSLANGGSILEGILFGVLNGALIGALFGAALGAIGGVGSLLKGLQCIQKIGQFLKGTSEVTKALADTMFKFDMVSQVSQLFDSTKPLFEWNQKLKSNPLYNWFQFGIGALAAFTAGATATMKCFVAGRWYSQLGE